MKAIPYRLKPWLLFLLTWLAALPSANADKADREKPVHLEADRISVDDAKKLYILEGNVQLVRGTLVIHTAKLVVSQDADGFQKGIAYGGTNGLAHFRQKREGRNEYVEGEAERIEHDGRQEKTDFFNRAYIKSGLDEVSGQYISYDGRSENYVVTGSGSTAAGKGERVRAVIQPKSGDAKQTSPVIQRAPPLKPTLEIPSPRQE